MITSSLFADVIQSSATSLQKYEGGNWDASSSISYNVIGNEIEIAIPFALLEIAQGTTPEFHFKWADNPQNLNDVSAFFTDGEAAPDRRFNYNFDGSATLWVDNNALILEGLKVYPNPIKDRITLSAKNVIKDMSIYNLLGQEVLKSAVNSRDFSLDISTLKTGIYTVKVVINESVRNFKIVKE